MIKNLAAAAAATAGRTTMRQSISAAVAVALAMTIAACGSVAGRTGTDTAAESSSSPSAPAYTPSPSPSPAGKYVGSCSYTLNSNFSSSTAAWATGDIEVTNTGNVGIVVSLKITWPQEGYNPLVMRKSGVRIGYGDDRDIQFHLPLNQNQITNLQNYQSGHNYASGCTYKVTILRSFGNAG